MAPAIQQTMNKIAPAAGDTLAEMGVVIGGIVFHNSNDLLAGIKRAFADGRDYYNHAYVSTNSSLDGNFRAIRVEVSDRKAIVSAKCGPWATAN
jgi:hypothetical protein